LGELRFVGQDALEVGGDLRLRRLTERSDQAVGEGARFCLAA
jgi:hypothetical protein